MHLNHLWFVIEYLEAKVCTCHGQQNGSQLKQTRTEEFFFLYRMMKSPSPNGLSNRDSY